jgi:catechol 2,3-dioxygenase-like lactoylglutathione lyase family enzyme
MNTKPIRMSSVTPMIPSGGSLAEALKFYVRELGFTVLWQSPNMAGIQRDAVAFNLIENSTRAWIENSSHSIGVSDLDALYLQYRGTSAQVGPLEVKPWGRREFHMIVPHGVCLQFYQAES